MTLDIEQIKADLAAGRTDPRRLEKLIVEIERQRISLDQANKRIIELLGENRVLKAELRGRLDEVRK